LICVVLADETRNAKVALTEAKELPGLADAWTS